MHPHSRMHIHVHMPLTQTHAAQSPRHAVACWDMQASTHTCFPLILTWLESWLPPGGGGEKKQRKQGYQSEGPARGFERRDLGMVLRLAIAEAEAAQTGTG